METFYPEAAGGCARMEFVSFLADEFYRFWPHLLSGTYFVLMVAASAHVVMYKKDSRAAIGWIGLILMVPILGAVLYALLGINRVARKAVNLRGGPALRAISAPDYVADRQIVAKAIPETQHLVSLETLVGELTGRPLLYGNRVQPLVGGEQAYPQMIEAIDAAQHSVGMTTYIFDNDRAGAMFAEALKRAVDRGVEVRVAVDAVGARYSFPSIVRRLRRDGVPVARFLPTLMPGAFAYANLRSHRKILVVDGRIGFTGGLNIREGHDARLSPKNRILDHHFRIEGPVVAQLQEVFAEDWAFCTDELLESEKWFPALEPVGDALARGISAGPDSDLDKLRLTLEGALACAETCVCILTPYFLPDGPLITALNVAALRGIEVDIILPEANNLTLVKWASNALLWQVLQRGCRVWMSPPPFDHTKLMVIDRTWVLLGSGNWDPRSLRLNFEFDVEVYDRELAAQVHELAVERRNCARPVTLADVDGRSIPVRLRDGVARLLTPYL